jgi:ketosteroid isomerase-like protein
MSEIEKRLEIIESRFAISELRSRYCWYTVRGMREELLALFTDDGVFENSRNEGDTPTSAQGKSELAAYFSKMKPARRVPLVTNEVTRVTGDLAEGTCAMVGVGDDGFAGHYIEQFRRVDGTWLFSRRQFFPYWPIYRPDAKRLHP